MLELIVRFSTLYETDIVELGPIEKPNDGLNEIESEVSGKVVKIIANDSSPVEFDQPLYEIEPSK